MKAVHPGERRSGLGSLRSELRSKTVGIAIASLAAVVAQSCLLSGPPTYEDPAPERPNVNVNQVIPPVYQVLNIERQASIDFTIPFRSVDGEADIWAYLWLNWNLKDEEPLLQRRLEPGSEVESRGFGGAGGTERAFIFPWSVEQRVKPGCNQLTLFLVHDPYADVDNFLPENFDKAAVLTWWVNVDAPSGEEQTLRDCPGSPAPLTVP